MSLLRQLYQKLVGIGLWLTADPRRLAALTTLVVALAFAAILIVSLSPTAVFIGPSGGGSGGGPG